MQHTYLVFILIAIVLVCGIVSSTEAKSKSFNLKVNLWDANSLSGKIKIYTVINHNYQKTINVGKLAQKLDKSEIPNAVTFKIKQSDLFEGESRYEVCAYSSQLHINQCTDQPDNGKKTQTILVKVPTEGDEDEDGDY